VDPEVRYYIARLWRTMVSSYTSLDITKSGDRLPALGGLAKHMSLRRSSRYLAGLWEDSLNDDLLWAVYTTSTYKRPRPLPRTAPTWSWASVDTYALYFDEILYWNTDEEAYPEDEEREPYEHFSEVTRCEVTPSAVDEFGAISQGQLEITGLLASGTIEREVQTFEGRDNIVHYVSFPGGIRLPMKADYLLDEAGPAQVPPGSKASCLRMSRIQSGSTEYLVSLVLRPLGGVLGMYERIGTLMIEARPAPVHPTQPIYSSATEETVVII